MKISIVIPVYNEAERLGACLEAISRQQLMPDEVIVVDNNSSDATADIADSFGFVKLIREPRQGVVHARNTGFDLAKGEIIGRIDADTLLPTDWTLQIKKIFDDQSISAVSGSAHYYDFKFAGLADQIDLALRGRLARKLGDNNFLWGANMAIRRSAWLEVRSELCAEADMHEDFDLGIHLQAHNLEVAYDQSLLAGVSSRRIDSGFVDYVNYSLVSPRTYAKHHLASRRHMYPVLFVCWLGYAPGRLIYRSYDQETGAFSMRQLLSPQAARVDPTANII